MSVLLLLLGEGVGCVCVYECGCDAASVACSSGMEDTLAEGTCSSADQAHSLVPVMGDGAQHWYSCLRH